MPMLLITRRIGQHVIKKLRSSVPSSLFSDVYVDTTDHVSKYVDVVTGHRDNTFRDSLCAQTPVTYFTLILQDYRVTNIHSNVRTKI
jgi:hypothetical protein